ncbi:hypothetical protein, partial [Sporisorium scitamineum]
MARSTPSFAPTPPASAASISSSPPKRTFQSTLFNVKFGAQRSRLPPTKDEASVAKRTRSQSASEHFDSESADDAERSEKVARTLSKASTAAPKYHHRGPFHQVTQPEFCSTYKIDDLPDAEVYYKPDFIDRSLAQEWRSQLDRLPEWYRPKLK